MQQSPLSALHQSAHSTWSTHRWRPTIATGPAVSVSIPTTHPLSIRTLPTPFIRIHAPHIPPPPPPNSQFVADAARLGFRSPPPSLRPPASPTSLWICASPADPVAVLSPRFVVAPSLPPILLAPPTSSPPFPYSLSIFGTSIASGFVLNLLLGFACRSPPWGSVSSLLSFFFFVCRFTFRIGLLVLYCILFIDRPDDKKDC